jgi:hypothetical protein
MDVQILAAFAGHLISATTFARIGGIGPDMPEVCKRVDIVIADQVNTAAITAVTAIRAAKGNVFLTTKADYTRAAVAGNYIYGCFVYKTHVQALIMGWSNGG